MQGLITLENSDCIYYYETFLLASSNRKIEEKTTHLTYLAASSGEFIPASFMYRVDAASFVDSTLKVFSAVPSGSQYF